MLDLIAWFILKQIRVGLFGLVFAVPLLEQRHLKYFYYFIIIIIIIIIYYFKH